MYDAPTFGYIDKVVCISRFLFCPQSIRGGQHRNEAEMQIEEARHSIGPSTQHATCMTDRRVTLSIIFILFFIFGGSRVRPKKADAGDAVYCMHT